MNGLQKALALVLKIFVDALHQAPVRLLNFAVVVALFLGDFYVLLLLFVRKLLDSSIFHFFLQPLPQNAAYAALSFHALHLNPVLLDLLFCQKQVVRLKVKARVFRDIEWVYNKREKFFAD